MRALHRLVRARSSGNCAQCATSVFAPFRLLLPDSTMSVCVVGASVPLADEKQAGRQAECKARNVPIGHGRWGLWSGEESSCRDISVMATCMLQMQLTTSRESGNLLLLVKLLVAMREARERTSGQCKHAVGGGARGEKQTQQDREEARKRRLTRHQVSKVS